MPYRAQASRRSARTHLRSAIAYLVAMTAAATQASASPVTDPTAGAAVFTGPVSPNATSLTVNPAAVGLGQQGWHFYAAATGTVDNLSIDRRNINVQTGALTPGAQVTDVTASPGGTFALWRTTDTLTVGFTLFSPAPAEKYSSDEDALRYSTTGGLLRTTNLATLSGNIHITDYLIAGASIGLSRTRLLLGFDRDSALAAGRDANRGINSNCLGVVCGLENPAAAENYLVDVSPSSPLSIDTELSLNFGVVFRVAPKWWIGVAYHAPPGSSIENFDSTINLDGNAIVTRAPRDGGKQVIGSATVNVALPPSVDIGVSGPISHDLQLVAGFHWEDQSVTQSYDVRLYGGQFATALGAGIPQQIMRARGLSDPFSGWVGVEQIDRGQRWLFGARVGGTTPGVEADRTTPTSIEGYAATLNLGAQLRIAPGVVAQFSYGLEYFPTVSVTASAFNPLDQLDCIDSGMNYTTAACAAVRNGYAQPTEAGDYLRIEHSFRLGLRYDFQ